MPERRRDASAAIIHLIEALTQQVHAMSEKLDKHDSNMETTRAEIISKLLAECFPDGDHEGHRRYHESVIAAAKERAAFWKKMREELQRWGLFGFLGWALYALWTAFLQGPTK